jgi:hypothetical protein
LIFRAIEVSDASFYLAVAFLVVFVFVVLEFKLVQNHWVLDMLLNKSCVVVPHVAILGLADELRIWFQGIVEMHVEQISESHFVLLFVEVGHWELHDEPLRRQEYFWQTISFHFFKVPSELLLELLGLSFFDLDFPERYWGLCLSDLGVELIDLNFHLRLSCHGPQMVGVLS